jgi:hypothetical protein
MLTTEAAIEYCAAQFPSAKVDVVDTRRYEVDGTPAIEVSAFVTGNFDGKAGYDYPIAMDVWVENGKLYGEW